MAPQLRPCLALVGHRRFTCAQHRHDGARKFFTRMCWSVKRCRPKGDPEDRIALTKPL